MAQGDNLDGGDVQALHELRQHLQQAGDPRADRVAQFLSASGAPVSPGGVPVKLPDIGPPVGLPPGRVSSQTVNLPNEERFGGPIIKTGLAGTALGYGLAAPVVGAIEHPVATTAALLGGGLAHKGAKMLNAPDWLADAAGVAGGAIGGLGSGRVAGALHELPEEVTNSLPFGKFARYMTGRGLANQAEERTATAALANRAANPPRTVLPNPRPPVADFQPVPATQAASTGRPPGGITHGEMVARPPFAPGTRTPMWQGVTQAEPRPNLPEVEPIRPAPRAPVISAPTASAAPVTTKPTPEEMASSFQSDETKVGQFNARKDLQGAAKHMANRQNAARAIADYGKSKGYDDPEVMQAAQPEHWRAVAKAAGFPDVSNETIAAAKSLLKGKP